MKSIVISFVILTLCWINPATAAPPTAAVTPPTEGSPDQLTRVYDIRDLITTHPDFPYASVMGLQNTMQVEITGPQSAVPAGFGGGGGAQAPSDQAPSEPYTKEGKAAELIKLVTDTVAPTSWRAAGSTGDIRFLSGMLVVTQAPDIQDKIASLFQQLRQYQKIVRVQATWIVLTPEQFATLMEVGQANPKDHASVPQTLAPTALMKLLPAEAVRYRGEISCFDGQMVSLSSGLTRSVIYDVQPVVAQGAVALTPTMQQINCGAMLEITPTVQADGSSVVVNLRSEVAEWQDAPKMELSTATTQPSGSIVAGPAAMDRVHTLGSRLQSALRCRSISQCW